ncbi:cardiolipin synthase [Parabacteroides sp. PF5-5]|uniref:cardiolipin synthase n=1 Tax=unclassified Parabacteroides TaxID=2649774 RepID=UPI0024738D3A|nr:MULTISPECIES: cardiolipin synthase [unclassified Parabacteroides]MDH6306109.1 cardiolipin synthase [Parabacteroides sp. PH5-39]MDH6316993.1 cardiolipin synthase [Parabacteroides sp. PF5-13]MDH6320746.1 cardiolipin synthase [Parabacteroides sp. PH5-13]MDH6324552.1 cardiolipin synthase [Parabacteroides sp. PH5-8]MDH6328178.1 cardiolipin synthase [Parabacteroides sp. PH5-41]
MWWTSIEIKTVVGLIFILLYSLTILGLVLVIITENRNPLKTIPWVIVLMFLPGVGLLFYFYFGQDNRKQRIISRRTYKRIMKHPHTGGKHMQDFCVVPEQYKPLVTLLGHNHQTPLFYGTEVTTYTSGPDKFNALMEELEQATHHIHLQYYIFLDDEIGNQIKSILINKAKAGVEVRVLYDDVGCWNVKPKFFKEMTEAGIEVYAFLRVAFPVLASKVNYRNHRKIVIIDGKVGFMGGMNIADRYVKGTTWGDWRDTHFKFVGKGVQGLQSAFLIDWYVVSKKLLNNKIYYPPAAVYSDNIMQILTSGPTGPWRTLLQSIIFMISNAKKYVYLQTPYFLPTEGLNQALQTAALGGVDVRLMLPKRSDTKTANMASRSFIDDMVKAGAKVFFYESGFLHAKLVVCDDEIACIGSSNMDFRSFEHNFEVNAFIYQKDFALQMKKIFQHDVHSCEKLIPTRWLRRPIKQRIAESFMRLFSPLL